ncbi:MAG: hypothetical protein ACREBR_00965, partial [bacterium]
VQNFHFSLQFLFGATALVTSQVGTWVNHIFNNKVLYTSIQAHTPNFYASVCFAIDRGVQSYLISCMISKERTLVDDSCINYAAIQDSINRRTFTFILPPSMNIKEKKGSGDNLGDNKRKTVPNKSNTGDRAGKRLQNNDRVSKWALQSGESYKIFNDQASRCPKIGDKFICMRYHLKGFCFEPCERSHIMLTGQNEKLFDKFIQSCRASKGGDFA